MIPFQLGVLKLLLAYFIVSASIEKRALQRDKKQWQHKVFNRILK